MARGPIVSVITVTYNDRDGLATTAENVRNQTYSNIEYVVVDGASGDGTREWLEQHDDRIDRWISEPDQGLYDAMNKGLDLATGDFVIFMNAGDLFDKPATIEECFANHNGEDIVYGDAVLTDENFNVIGYRRHKRLPKQLTRWSMRLGMVVCHQSVFVRRKIAPHYDLRYKHSADIDWLTASLERGAGVLNAGVVVSKFMVGGHSTFHRQASWKERWHIVRRHFGLAVAILAHAEIVARAGLRKLGMPV